MQLREFITIDPEIMSGAPVFTGTRVPVQSLFWHLEKGISIEDFMDDFPSVRLEQIQALLELAGRAFSQKNMGQFYEAAVG